MREIEAKIRLRSGELDRLRARLVELHARRGPSEEESNTLFEAPDGRLRPAGQILRLRCFAGRADATMTFKGPVDPGSPYKSRDELEMRVDDGSTARAILDALGYQPTAVYCKRRERWSLDDAEIALDSLSSGDYAEIEGAEDAIARVLASLGLADRPHIRALMVRQTHHERPREPLTLSASKGRPERVEG
jgi:adenylate cyclase, class 2